MPRLVSFLLFTLLLSAQTAPAAHLPEIQPAGSSKTGAAVQSTKENSARPEAADAPGVLVSANASQPDTQGETPHTAPVETDQAENAPGLGLAASPALKDSDQGSGGQNT